jgi:hypothetical protein
MVLTPLQADLELFDDGAVFANLAKVGHRMKPQAQYGS